MRNRYRLTLRVDAIELPDDHSWTWKPVMPDIGASKIQIEVDADSSADAAERIGSVLTKLIELHEDGRIKIRREND